MTTPPAPPKPESGVHCFRWKLLGAVAFVVSAVTLMGLYFAGRNATARAEQAFQHEFQLALAALHHTQAMRCTEINGHCDALVRNPRIHAALEDDAVDLLYYSARDQLHDLIYTPTEPSGATMPRGLRATFYRFLDAHGKIIPPSAVKKVGELTAFEEQQLILPDLPKHEQHGYIVRTMGAERETPNEVITVPIASSETGEHISALMVGFEPVEMDLARAGDRIRQGIWLKDTLYLRGFEGIPLAELSEQIGRVIQTVDGPEQRFTVRANGESYLVFYKKLNPGSVYPTAYEVCLYPLADSLAAQRWLRWQIGALGLLVLLAGLLASHLVSRRFATPVEQLATHSAETQAQRVRAEAALESTSRELQRAARFSADASHQLKTPVTVLRVGLEEVLSRDHLPEESRLEISELIHQTYRLNGVIEDLLLLSRMDAGRLRLEIGVVDLTQIVEGWLDDLSVLPDPLEIEVETSLPSRLLIAGEKRYTTLIVQNLLENARKYNRAQGRVHVAASDDGQGGARLTIGNTGQPIEPTAREHIFERFHRGAAGENIPGQGLGLNLARELARLHGGDLRLVRSETDWTEFAVTFRLATPTPAPGQPG